MKCPKCLKNHQKKYGMRCSCGYEFALDPVTFGMADGKLLSLVRRASGNDTLYFTRPQLITSDSRISKATGYGCLAVAVVALTIAISLLDASPVFWITMVIGVLGVLASYTAFFITKPDDARIFRALDAFQNKHGKFDKLVETPSLDSPPSNDFEPDIYDYGVEKILIVQRPLIVDLLVKNKVHVQTRSLIMCSDGYPKYLNETLTRLLNESPELPVFFLHDSTPAGMQWLQIQLESPRLNNGKRKLIDMGFSPDDLKRLRRLDGLRLGKNDYQAPLDVVPMAMLANGIFVSFEQELPLSEIMEQNVSSDSSGSFG